MCFSAEYHTGHDTVLNTAVLRGGKQGSRVVLTGAETGFLPIFADRRGR